MKAVTYEKYGGPEVLQFRECPKPTPQDNEVLVKINATCLNAADWRILRADPCIARFYSGLFKPKFPILGSDIAGIVESVGKNIQQFKTGDEVFGGLIEFGWGGLAEYVSVPQEALVLKPSSLTFEEAATIPVAGLTALTAIRDLGKVKPGDDVLINGSGGGVGTFALQLAKHFGAKVTAVCGSANAKLAKKFGADRVIDYTKEDFTKERKRYDLILGVNGYHPITAYRNALNPGGNYVMIGGTGKHMFEAIFFGPLLSLFENKRLRALSITTNQQDLAYLARLMGQGVIKAAIDRRYSLEQAPEAFSRLERGHVRGKVIINIEP